VQSKVAFENTAKSQETKDDQDDAKKKKRKRSDSSSSEEITIKINLKKALEKCKHKKRRTINIETQESSDDQHTTERMDTAKKPEEPKIVSQKKPSVEPEPNPEPEIKKTPEAIIEKVAKSLAKNAVVESSNKSPVPEVVQAEPVPDIPATTKTELSKTQSGNPLSSLGLGVKVVPKIMTYVVKPKTVKTAADLDPTLRDLALVLTNKNSTDETKGKAKAKFSQDAKDRKYVKITLSDKGKEKSLPDISALLKPLQPTALKLYVIGEETEPVVVGGYYWDTLENLGKVGEENLKLTVLELSNPDDEKVITNTLKSCLKAKQSGS
jgi:hypothetical protein